MNIGHAIAPTELVPVRWNVLINLSQLFRHPNNIPPEPEPFAILPQILQEDEVVPNVLVLHPSSRAWLQNLPEVLSGQLVLQDRSSCLSALAAGLTPGVWSISGAQEKRCYCAKLF